MSPDRGGGGLPPATHDGDIVDVLGSKPVLHRETVHHGLVWDVVRDTVDLGRAARCDASTSSTPGRSVCWPWTTVNGC